MNLFKIGIILHCFSCFSIFAYSTADYLVDPALNRERIEGLSRKEKDIVSIINEIHNKCKILLSEVEQSESNEPIVRKLKELNLLFKKAKEIEKITISKKIPDTRGEDLAEYIYHVISKCVIFHNNHSGPKITINDVIK